MGVYIYALRSPKKSRTVVVEKKDGERITVDVGSMSFAYKSGWNDTRARQRYVAPAARKWENTTRGDRPKYVAITTTDDNHSIKVGSYVVLWQLGAPTECSDTPHYGDSVPVGKVVEIVGMD